MKLFSKHTLGLMALTGVLLAGLLALVVARLRADERLPQPNGYDDFVKAGKSVIGSTSSVDSKSPAQVAAFAAQNSAVLAQVRSGLGKESRTSVEFKAGWMMRHTGDIMALRQAGNALELLAKEREAAGAIDEAVSIRSDAVRMGVESYRGGLLIDYLIGTAVEQWSLTNLAKMTPRLEATQCRGILKVLEESDARRTPMSEVERHDRSWSWLGSGWWQSWDGVREMAEDIFKKPSAEFPVPSGGRQEEILTSRRWLTLALARRAFELEQGKPPANDAELVPTYLPRLP